MVILVIIVSLCDLCFGLGDCLGDCLGVLEKYENYAVISNFAVST